MDAGLYVGVDVGTSASKAILADAEGHIVARGRADHVDASHAGRVDTARWWSSVVQAVSMLGDRRRFATAVGLSVHSPVLVPLDRDGAPLADGYRFDAPGLPGLVSAAATALGLSELDRIGNAFTPATAIAVAGRLFTRQHDDPSQLRWLGSAGTVVGHRLTGEIAIDPSQASYYGCFDVVGGRDWLPAALGALGIDPGLLPEVRPSQSQLGRLRRNAAEQLGLPADVPVVVGGGDTPSTALAVGLDAADGTLLTFGTTHVLTQRAASPDPGNRRFLQRAHLLPESWLTHGATNGGHALREGAHQRGRTGARAVWDTVQAASARSAPDAGRTPFWLPHVIPERGPMWLAEPVSEFMDGDASSPDADWSVVEGVLFADRLVLEQADPTRREVRVSADIAHGLDLVQLTADVLERELLVYGESHVAALGAAMVGMRAVGADPPALQPSVRVAPRPDTAAVVAERWPRWRARRAERLGL